MNRRRAVVLIAEGLAPDLCSSWMRRGLLPAFSQMFKHGAGGPINSNFVPYEPPGLLTAFTGTSAGEHGWFSYWNVHDCRYRPVPKTSEQLLVPFLWQRPEMEGKRCGLVNLFGTHPPQPLNGWLISYPTSQTLHATYPSSLSLGLAKAGLSFTHDVSVWFAGQRKGNFVPLVLEADARRGAIAEYLFDQGADMVIANLTCIDRLSHCYWQEIEPGSPVPLEESAVFQAYQCCDRVIGKFLEKRTEDVTLLVFSEIGFGPLRAYLEINQILAEHDLLLWKDAERTAPDWARTQAFEAVQGTQGININLRSRYQDGTVDDSQYEACCQKVRDVLIGAINPHTGLPLLKRVAHRTEIYPGAHTAEAPDLILEPADPRYLPFGEPSWARHVRRKLQSGWHRRTSLWAAVGEEMESGCQMEAELLDIAPTLMDILGAGSNSGLPGISLKAKLQTGVPVR